MKESKLRASRLARVMALAVVACFTQCVPARAQAGSPNQAPAVSLAEARTVIEQAEKAWAKARVVIDTNLFEKTLAPDFYAQFPDSRLTRKEFLDLISKYPDGVKLKRFDNQILTVEQHGDISVALVLEKLEIEHQIAGKTVSEYLMGVTRDGFKRYGKEWKAVFSEVVGAQEWNNGQRPPMKDW